MNYRFSFDVAWRYLFAKKSQNVINIISAISAMGVMVATAALIIILSVFNGLNGLVESLFGAFDPDLKIVTCATDSTRFCAKTFDADSALMAQVRSVNGVAAASVTLQDQSLVRYGKRQVTANVLGVDAAYGDVTRIDSILLDGAFRPQGCIIGAILADQLAVSSMAFAPQVTFYAPKRVGKINMQNPEASFVETQSMVAGTFLVQQNEYDANYIVANLDMTRELFCYDGCEASAIAIRLAPDAQADDVANNLANILPEGLTVKNKWQQHESFFRMMEVEKFMAFAILLFIVLIAAFNIIGSLSMLIFEKKESIEVLRSMGADESLTSRIFLFEGWLVSVGGSLLGLLLGIALVVAQEQWELVKFGSPDDYIIAAYPVELQWSDVALVFVSVLALAVVVAWYPVRVIVRRYYESHED